MKLLTILTLATVLSQVCSQDGVTLYLKGALIVNNGYVDVDDIDEGDNALLCRTNNMKCCRYNMAEMIIRAGEWHFPNGTTVKNKHDNSMVANLVSYFYRDREFQVVRLNRIHNPQEYGKFYCIVANNMGTKQTIHANIVNLSAIMMSHENQFIEAAGANVTLNCSFQLTSPTNVDPPRFKWFFGLDNSTTLPSGVTVSNVTESSKTYTSTLQFSPLNQSHEGMYTCRVGGNERLAANVVITVKCVIVALEHINYTILEGYSLEVCFFARGNAANMEQVTISTETGITAMGDVAPTNFTSQLVRINKTKTCINIPTNYDTTSTKMDKQFSITISSNIPPVCVNPARSTALVIIQNIPPLDVEPMIMSVTLGENAIFKVLANFSDVKFQWLHNMTNISSEGMNSVLTVTNVMKTNGGKYSCVVYFPFGRNIISKEAQLFVFSPASISRHPSNQTVAQSGTAGFSVNASGDGLTYQWQKNGANIPGNASRYEGVSTAVLRINDAKVDDSGTYRCIVSNGAGDNVTSNEAILTVISSPTITNYSFESNSIAIYWEQDDLAQSYKIQYNFTIRECANEMARPDIKQELSETMKKTNYTIRNGTNMRVEEDSNYNISLVAVISNVSSPATIISGTTKQTAPSGAPMSVTNISENSTSIHIAWEHVACDQRNGKIDGYNVTYYPKGDSSDKTTATVSDKNRTFVASGLQPLTNYTFEVLAFNGAGYGPAANGTFQTLVAEAPIDPTINATISYPQSNPIVGKSYNLSCLYNVSEGFVAHTTVLWIHPNRTNFTTSSIEFDALRASDSGKYTCRVTLGRPQEAIAMQTYNLTIQFPPPNVSISLPNTTLYAGSTVNLTCNVILESKIDVNVTLNITWLQGSANTAINTTLISPPYTISLTSILTLSPLSASDNNITCSASILPVEETSQFLKKSPIQSASKSLQIMNPTINVTISPSSLQIPNVGDTFNITCTVHGLDSVDPTFAYQWTNNSKGDHSTISNRSTVAFPALKLSNGGKYECKVNVSSNYFIDGYVIGRNTYNLSIKIPEPSSVKVSHSPEMIYAGSNFTLKCNITLSMNIEEVILESLQISVKWIHSRIGMIGSEVNKSASLMCNTSISITSANHSHDGTYTCDAKVRAIINSPYLVTSSKTSASVEIAIIQAPSAPTIKKLLPLNSTSVNITWMIENDINKVDYVTIQYMYVGSCSCPDQVMCQWNQLNKTTIANYSIISDLQEYSTYLFKITAYNPVGPSGSNEKNVTTLSAAPTGAPQSLTITATNLTSITVTWDEVQCIKRNSDITGYMIKLNGSSYTTDMLRQFIAVQLFPSTTYTFQIAAMSINGPGPFNNITGSTSQPQGVSLLLNGEHKLNNSVIVWSEIREGGGSLFCLTNNTDCCEAASDSGNWVDTDNNTITDNITNAIYQAHRKNSTLLQRKEMALDVQLQGIFRCDIVDANNKMQHLYVGIYHQSENRAHLNSISFNVIDELDVRFSLNCSSRGGPVNKMLWLHDDQEIQNSSCFPILLDAELGLYSSTLVIDRALTGKYICKITNESNRTIMTRAYEVKVLHQPVKARAVWTTINESFHICWDSHNTINSLVPAPTTYIIRDNSYQNLMYVSYNGSIKSYCADIRQLSTSKSVVLQAVSQEELPSAPLHINISESGVSLFLGGHKIENGSALSIELIGEDDKALICQTNKIDCCGEPKANRFGEWYHFGESITAVPVKGANESLYRDRRNGGKVRLNKRANRHVDTGKYCCMVPDSDDNCGIDQTLCINLGSLIISENGENIAGKNYSLVCEARVASMPTLIWTISSGSIEQLPSVMVQSTTSASDSRYISVIRFAPLQASHEGEYTCEIPSLDSQSFKVTVKVPDIEVTLSSTGNQSLGEIFQFSCKASGFDDLNPIITYYWVDSQGEQVRNNSTTFSFHPVSLLHAGEYTCTVIISSAYLGSNITQSAIETLTIEMPNPIKVSIHNLTNPGGGPLFIPRGSITRSISLICNVTLHTLVNVPVTISYTWSGENLAKYYTVDSNTINSSSTLIINNLTLEDAGVYTCQVDVNSTNPFITGTGTMMSTTNVALYEIHITKIEGEIYLDNAISLNCTVESRRTDEQFAISWIYSQTERNIPQNSTYNSLSLWFASLRASHAGVYVCNASLAPTTGSEQSNITLQLLTNVTASVNNTEPVRAGVSISIACTATTDRTLVDVPVDVELHLASPQGGNKTQKFLISSNQSLHQISMDFSNISAEMSGVFTCNATISASAMNNFLIPAHENNTYDLILVPSRPNIDTVQVTNSSITIAWSQATGDRIDNYIIEHSYQDICNHSFHNGNNHSNNQKNVTLTNLEEFSRYQVNITAVNSQGVSSLVMNISTLSSAPTGEPQNVIGTTINSTSMHIQWSDVDCIKRNGEIMAYNVTHRAIGYPQPSLSSEILPTERSLTLSKLIPRTNYSLTIAAQNVNGSGPSRDVVVSTSVIEGVTLFHNGSFHPNNTIINVNEIGEGTMALFCFTNKSNCCSEAFGRSGEWYFPNGSAVGKQLNSGALYRNRGPSVIRLNQKNTSLSPTGIFHCEVPLENGINQNLYAGLYPTTEGKPKIQMFMFEANTQSLICVSTDGPASNIIWRRNEERLSTQKIAYTQVQEITNMSESTYINTLTIRGVAPSEVAGNYSCLISNLRGSAEEHNLEIKDIRVTGHESAFPFGTTTAQLNCSTDLAVSMIEWLDAQGKELNKGTYNLLELITNPSESLMYTCRIMGAFGNQTMNITLTVLPEESEISSTATFGAAIAAVLLAVLLVVIVIVSILIVRRKSHGKLMFPQRVKSKLRSTFVIHATPLHGVDNDDDDKLEMSIIGKSASIKHKGIVPVEQFDNHVKKMHSDRDQHFEDEYASISKEPQNSYAASEILVNKLRNRFGNIFPYDHCRVKLKEIAGCEHSDYINASYMDGYQKPGAYIAAQGPLPNTLDDFWRMIWEKRLTTIVMLTQCFEGRKKCESYWPENINETFEPGEGIKIVLTSTVPFSEYTIRKMTVTRDTEPDLQPLEVIQFHFIAWPDHGVPDNCAVMLNFIRRVRKLHPYSNPCPLLVHCSAGVGRTGTFIVLDTMLERMKEEDTLNIYDYVTKLRKQRVLMVQTLAQYVFIHDALKEYILCGQTEIIASDIRKVIEDLSEQHDPCSAATGFEHQFQILRQLHYVSEEDCYSNATKEHNIAKNRYSNKLPNNFFRVRLKSSGIPGSDYINASFIHGYRQKRTYIATQGPLESTVCDFWRMVWESESKCTVLLTQLNENDKEMCYCYWPTAEGHAETYGQISVKLLTEERYGYCDLRKFEIDEEKVAGVEGVKTAFTVTQFHFLEWPEHETPPITSSLIELMGNVNKVQMGAGIKPIIVMCNDGVGRTGTFICIHAQLERLKTEGVFDFFQFIKSARMQRAGLVSDSVQYVLCHEVLADYLESFDTYANFKEVM